MADEVSSGDIVSYIQAQQAAYGGNNAQSQAAIAQAMDQYGVTPAQVAAAIGSEASTVQSLYNAVAPTGNYSSVTATPAGNISTGIASLPVNNPVNVNNVFTPVADTRPEPTVVPAPTATPTMQPTISNVDNTGIASIPITNNTTVSPLDTFAQAYANNPKMSNVQIGQLIADLKLTPAQAAKITGVDEKTANENYLSGQQLLANNPNLGVAYNTVQQGGKIQVVGSNEDGSPQYALNNQIVNKNPDGTFSFASGNNTRGGTDTYTFSVDKDGNAVAPTDPLSAYKWSPGSDASWSHFVGESLVSNWNSVAPAVSMALSMFPATAPYMAAFNAYNAAKGGNYVGALVSALSAAGAFGTQAMAEADALAKAGDFAGAASKLDGAMGWLADNASLLKTTSNVISGVDAATKGNYVAALNAVANSFNTGLGKDATTALNFATAAKALQSGDTAGLLLAIGNLTESPDAKTAASAVKLQTALNKGANPTSIATAFQSLVNNFNAPTSTTPTTTPTTTADNINNSTNLFTNGQEIPITNFNNDVTAVVGDSLLASADGSVGPKPLKANELQLDRVTGMPKYIGVYDFNSKSNVPVSVQQDAAGNYFYVADGETIGIDKTVYERAFYKANPQAYLDMAQKVYGTDIQSHLSDIGITNKPGATPVTTVENQPTKPSSFSDFFSKLNLKSLMGGETAEAAMAMTQPDIAKAISKGLAATGDTSYVNQISDYYNKATTPEDKAFYQSLMSEVVKQNPSLLTDATVLSVIPAGGGRGTTVPPSTTPTTTSTYDKAKQQSIQSAINDIRKSIDDILDTKVTNVAKPDVIDTKDPANPTGITEDEIIQELRAAGLNDDDTSPIQIGDYTFDPVTGELTKNTQNITNEPTTIPETTVKPVQLVTPVRETTVEPVVTSEPTVKSTEPSTKPTVNPTTEVTSNPTVKPTTEVTNKPTQTNEPTQTTKPTQTNEPTQTTKPTQTVEPTQIVKPTQTVEPTQIVKPTQTVEPTQIVRPTQTTEPTQTVKPTQTTEPTATVTPTVTTKPTEKTVEPTVTTQPTQSVSPTPTAKPTTSVVQPTTTVNPTVASPTTGLTMPQAVAAAAAFGVPQLANMFYYGKDFETKKQHLNKKGELEEEEYKPLSVQKPGAEPEQVAEKQKVSENDVSGLLEHILGNGSNSASLDEILNIVKGA